MELPLFKGVSSNDLSLLLEKIPLDFHQLPSGSVILKEGQEYDSVSFLLSGEADVVNDLYGGRVRITQRVGSGTVLCADRLVGLYTKVPFTVVAHTGVGVMRIRKRDYLSLLEMNRIFLINYLTYVSYKSQVRMDSMRMAAMDCLEDFCRHTWQTAGERRVFSTTWEFKPDILAQLIGIAPTALAEELSKQSEKDDVTVLTGEEVVKLTYTGRRPD